MSPEVLSPLLCKADLCKRLAIAPRTLEYLVTRGQFPPPVRIGKRVYWSEFAVSNWQRQLFAGQETWAP